MTSMRKLSNYSGVDVFASARACACNLLLRGDEITHRRRWLWRSAVIIGDPAFYHACIWGYHDYAGNEADHLFSSYLRSERPHLQSGNLNDTNYARAKWIVFVLFRVKHLRTGSLMTGFMPWSNPGSCANLRRRRSPERRDAGKGRRGRKKGSDNRERG